MQRPANIRFPGKVDYDQAVTAMRALTTARSTDSRDEIWLLEHPPVFTLGLNASRTHLLAPGDTPVMRTDRGGQVTWHGPGQVVAYVLMDIGRAGFGVREFVTRLERAVIDMLSAYAITAICRREAPGVYVDGRKIASVGLRIRRGRSYHGIALNVVNSLEPFACINPCGYAGLEVTRTADLGGPTETRLAAQNLLDALCTQLELTPQDFFNALPAAPPTPADAAAFPRLSSGL